MQSTGDCAVNNPLLRLILLVTSCSPFAVPKGMSILVLFPGHLLKCSNVIDIVSLRSPPSTVFYWSSFRLRSFPTRLEPQQQAQAGEGRDDWPVCGSGWGDPRNFPPRALRVCQEVTSRTLGTPGRHMTRSQDLEKKCTRSKESGGGYYLPLHVSQSSLNSDITLLMRAFRHGR